MHPAIFPTDLTKYSGREEDCYSKTVPTMLTFMGVLESGKLKN